MICYRSTDDGLWRAETPTNNFNTKANKFQHKQSTIVTMVVSLFHTISFNQLNSYPPSYSPHGGVEYTY